MRAFFITAASAERDSRVLRAAKAAKSAGYEVHVIGFEASGLNLPVNQALPWENSCQSLVPTSAGSKLTKIQFGLAAALSRLSPASFLKQKFVNFLPNIGPLNRAAKAYLSKQPALSPRDVIHLGHWQCWPGVAGFFSDPKMAPKLVYDFAELSCVERAYDLIWAMLMPPMVKACELAIIKRAECIGSVIPDPNYHYFQPHYGIDCSHVFIPNQPVQQVDGSLDVDDCNEKGVLYLGAIRPERGIEQALQALKLTSKPVQLTLQGYGSKAYLDCLLELANKLQVIDRFQILPPVSPDKVVQSALGYQAGLALFPLKYDQLRLAQPNKVFQYLSAGVPLIVSRGGLLADQISAPVNSKVQQQRNFDFGLSVEFGAPDGLALAFDQLCEQASEKRESFAASFLQKIDAKDFDDLFIFE